MKPYTQGRTYIGRIPAGVDLLGAVTRIANEQEIKVGTVQIYGTVSAVSLSVFDQVSKFPKIFEYTEGMEVATVSGTISQFKRRSLAKLGGVFVRLDGSVVAGTVALGTTTHACEAVITELEGGTLSRDFDMETGLPLWKEQSFLIGSDSADE